MSICERKKNLKRRRLRRAKVKQLRGRIEKTTDKQEKDRLMEKVLKISPDVFAQMTGA